nr:MAG TPA: hypothetical protein [Bacteriophage sp.]
MHCIRRKHIFKPIGFRSRISYCFTILKFSYIS